MKSIIRIFVLCFLGLTTAYIIPNAKNFPTVYSPKGECPAIEGEYPVLLPDNEDLNVFYICAHGTPVKKKCPYNMVFDPQVNVCVNKIKFDENPKTSLPIGKCPPKDGLTPVYLLDSEDSSIFYECSNGNPIKHKCPTGLIFNITLKVCVRKEFDLLKELFISFLPKGECPPKDGETPVFLPDTEDPSVYYECAHGFPVKMKCPKGLVFDLYLNVCVYPPI